MRHPGNAGEPPQGDGQQTETLGGQCGKQTTAVGEVVCRRGVRHWVKAIAVASPRCSC
jgi:hypothetical protein